MSGALRRGGKDPNGRPERLAQPGGRDELDALRGFQSKTHAIEYGPAARPLFLPGRYVKAARRGAPSPGCGTLFVADVDLDGLRAGGFRFGKMQLQHAIAGVGLNGIRVNLHGQRVAEVEGA